MGEFSQELVSEALTSVRCKDINRWLDQAFGKCDKQFLEQNQEQINSAMACNF